MLFCRIKNCAEIAILGNNPYTNRQLINNAFCLLLITGLNIRAFDECDHLDPATEQTWIKLCSLIQEAFQRHLNAMVPMLGSQGYAPVFHQDAFGILGTTDRVDKESLANMVAPQVVALTYQSQLTQSTAATTGQCQEMQLAQFATMQEAQHATMHQLIKLNAVAFNISRLQHQ